MRLGDLCWWRRTPAPVDTVPTDLLADGVQVYLHHCDRDRLDCHTPAPVERCPVCGEVGWACLLNVRGVVAVLRE